MQGVIDDDSIGLGSYIIDIHLGNGEGTICKKISPYGLPYGISVSADIDGLMLAGRCASMDSVALSSARVMPTCMCIGEGAGVGAALAVKQNISPRNVDVNEIRHILKASGVQLSPEE